MGEKIKAKAQDVRLALLEQLSKDVEAVAACDDISDRRRLLPELISQLNQLDPDRSCGSYGFTALTETAPEPKQ